MWLNALNFQWGWTQWTGVKAENHFLLTAQLVIPLHINMGKCVAIVLKKNRWSNRQKIKGWGARQKKAFSHLRQIFHNLEWFFTGIKWILIIAHKDLEFKSFLCDGNSLDCPDAIICNDSKTPQLQIAVHEGIMIDAIEINGKRFGTQDQGSMHRTVS